MVPWAYNNVLEEFFNETKNNSNLIIKEYIRAHHTFHAKGLWFDIDSSASATLVGSSNFGS
jgi:HKD family nuclease